MILGAQDRNIHIDIVRVVATVMIVMAHISATVYERLDFFNGKAWMLSFLILSISRLGVPLFFMVSGYLLVKKERSTLKNIKHTWSRLMVPFLIWTILTYIGLYISQGIVPSISIDLLLSSGGTTLYFLTGLAMLYLINPYLIIISRNTNRIQLLFLLIVLAITTVGQNFVGYYHHAYTFSIFHYWIMGLFYFVYGQYYRLYQERSSSILNSISLMIFIVPLLANTLIIYLIRRSGNGDNLMWESYFGPTVLLSSIGFFHLIMSLKLKTVSEKLKNCITSLSMLSFGVYLSHGIVLDLLLHKTRINPFGRVSINLTLYLAVISVLTFSFSILISTLLNKNKYCKKLVGL